MSCKSELTSGGILRTSFREPMYRLVTATQLLNALSTSTSIAAMRIGNSVTFVRLGCHYASLALGNIVMAESGFPWTVASLITTNFTIEQPSQILSGSEEGLAFL